ncbi:hypothetical protein [Rhodococcus sp. NPDC058514]|uniref:hypothetical protein n=1 Tax=unclassified Rhodococcus (in: high G+C Gram-positive bacteria) TaxID=192944 RepID=UPI003669FF0C
MLVAVAALAIVFTAAGSAGAESVVRGSGTGQVTSTQAPTSPPSDPGAATRYVSEPADNPGDQAYCNLQAERANLMAGGTDPKGAVWVVESANANGCRIVEA